MDYMYKGYVLYVPEEGNKDFEQSIWNEDIEENIFIYIKITGV